MRCGQGVDIEVSGVVDVIVEEERLYTHSMPSISSMDDRSST